MYITAMVLAVIGAGTNVSGLAVSNDAKPSYDFRERTRALAFDPMRFFPKTREPFIAIRLLGDDYGFPVYAIAVRKGCTDADTGAARRTCGERLTARMVRAPSKGEPARPRARGQRLFAALAPSRPQTDAVLSDLLDGAGLEWLEADVRQCPKAMAHLATIKDLRFSAAVDLTINRNTIVLHADKISVELGDYLTRSRYEGWIEPGSPGAWANSFASSLEGCWKPSTAKAPWQTPKD